MGLRDVTLGRYIPGDSVLHRLDARAKLLASVFIAVAAFATRQWMGYALLFTYIGGLIVWADLSPAALWRGLRPLAPVIFIAAAVHLFFTPGEPICSVGPLRLTREGIDMAGHMVIRLAIMLGGVSVMTLTTTPLAFTDGLERLFSPLQRIGVPAHEMAMMMAIALRFIPVLGEELEKIMKAQMARGADLESGSLIRRIRNLVPLLVPLFVSVFRRADDLGIAMEARGYRGGYGRTRMHELEWTAKETIAVALTGLVCVAATLI